METLINSRVVEANAPKALVIPADAKSVSVQLRDGDLSWDQFLKAADKRGRYVPAVVKTYTSSLSSHYRFCMASRSRPRLISISVESTSD